MNHLEYRQNGGGKWLDAACSGTIADCRYAANLASTDYRITDGYGRVVWEFHANPREGRVWPHTRIPFAAPAKKAAG